MYKAASTLRGIQKNPESYLIIHYSSQSLFDEVEQAFSPRITSVVVMFYETRQTLSFSLHSIAEELRIERGDVAKSYDAVEKLLLERFYEFAKSNFAKCWLHWNMRNLTFGLEHIEHRFKVLNGTVAPIITRENRVNVSDVFKAKYGPDYAPDPRMQSLMDLNGKRDLRFLTGAEEAAAFARQEFIRMNSSTISKVEFFRFVLELASKGKLKTKGRTLAVRVDRILESYLARVIALLSGILGIPSAILGFVLYFAK